MTTEHQSYVAYLIAPPHKANTSQGEFANQVIASQEKRIQEFIHSHSNSAIVKTFIETGESNRHRHRWPELESAVTYCLTEQAHLIVGEMRNLTHNEAFTKQILRLIGEKRLKTDISSQQFIGQIYCCDQPFIKNTNFVALVEHAKQQKKLHGQLIKAGLSRTSAKSGNPHATDVISKVNKPKIDNAIVFALMLQPVISEYQLQGFSQRKMVNMLNDEGFTAPEGGHWVLSQLQKVLERIKMNEAALTLEKQFLEYRARDYDDTTIAQMLNKLGIPAIKGDSWTVESIEKVSERIKQIHDIIRFNEFVIELMPVLEKYHIDELSEGVFAQEIQLAGIALPENSYFG